MITIVYVRNGDEALCTVVLAVPPSISHLELVKEKVIECNDSMDAQDIAETEFKRIKYTVLSYTEEEFDCLFCQEGNQESECPVCQGAGKLT